MIPRRVTLAAVLIAILTAIPTAQRLAEPQQRREALALYRTGQAFFSSEQFERAAEEFAKATGKDPLFTLAYYQAGQSYMNLKRYASAIVSFERCLDATRALYGLAETDRFEVEKQHDDEVREMRETVRVLQQSGQPLRAIVAEQHLRDLESRRTSLGGRYQPPAEALLALGSAHYRNGDAQEAESQWKAAIDVNPKLGEAYNNLAALYVQTGRYAEADAALKGAKRAGFRVNPQLEQDVKANQARR